MKYILNAVLAGAVMLGACDSPTDESAIVRYEMTTFRGHTLPVQLTISGEAGACLDSLYAARIELTSSTEARRITNTTRNCNGVRTAQSPTTNGVYQTLADTIRFTWEVGGFVGFMTEDALQQGSALNFMTRVFSEADPDAPQTQVWAVYQRR